MQILIVQILFLVFYNVDGYIEESNGEKHLVFASANQNKKVFTQNSGMKLKIKLKQ